MIEYEKIKSEYLSKFGPESLDYVIQPDYLHDGEEGFVTFIQEMKEAMNKNIPISPIDKDIYITS